MYRDLLPVLASDDAQKDPACEFLAFRDVNILLKADEEYGSSWLRRGAVGAYIVGIRKADRIEEQARKHNRNVLETLIADQRPEGAINDLRDLRRYLYLWEAATRDQLGLVNYPELQAKLGYWDLVAGIEAVVQTQGYDLFRAAEKYPVLCSMMQALRLVCFALENAVGTPQLTAQEQAYLHG